MRSAPGRTPPLRRADGPASRLPFALGATALLAAATARVTADGATWFGHRGPTCPLGACLGPLACPGCGLLRATAAAVQGDFAFAFAAHPAGPVVAALLLGATALHLDILRRGSALPAHRQLRRVGRTIFLCALPLAWLARLLAA